MKHIYLISFVALLVFNCDKRDYTFAIQNCYGENVEVIIQPVKNLEFELDSTMYLEGNRLIFNLTYPNKKIIGKASWEEVEKGFPFGKLTFISKGRTTIINKDDPILTKMDTDAIGEVGKPFCLCI